MVCKWDFEPMTIDVKLPDWSKMGEDTKIAKLPKRIRLKNGDWVYLK